MSETVIELEGVRAFYGSVEALKGVSLRVSRGEVVTLIGANGAGKSTTLRVISGIVRPRHGAVRILGQDTRGWPPHRTAALGVAHVPEGRRVFARLTVEENLQLGACLVRDVREIARRMAYVFELFPRLKERRAQKAGTMSGGEQQMLAIGRALMSNPQVILLDEPSMGLAPVLVEQIFATIAELNREGLTVLLVEQNAHQALHVAHRGYVLQTGRIVLSGDAGTLLANPDVREAYLGA
ncbi:MAG: ABC transporter ATP-binding protein [Clostridia bacterium]|nr:ABC transporter ATP-binding protein [Clostridia bacterium]